MFRCGLKFRKVEMMIGLLLYLFLLINPATAADSDDYLNEIQQGKSVEYYESGKVRSEVNYVDGLEQGTALTYDPDGNISDQDRFRDGMCVEMCEGDEWTSRR